MDRQLSNNFIVDFSWKIYVQICFIFRYWFLVLTRPFMKDSPNDGRQERTSQTIINSLMKNFVNEDIKLINPSEPVEETFMKKISEKDYDSAMKLAKKFDFDTDPIYKSMWENNEITVQLIDECLTKISETIWVLKECSNCIPPQLDVLKYLLRFGVEISSQDSLMTFVEGGEMSEENLTNEGKRFVQYRQNLTLYLDRLNLYEEILQRKHPTEHANHFDGNYYSSFRKKSAFELAINFANQADHDSLAVLFQHERTTLSKHFLVIIANLPETVSPAKYKDLIDIIFSLLLNNDDFASDKQKKLDWSYGFTNLVQKQQGADFESKFYAEHANYQRYVINFQLSKDMLTGWLRDRALEILDYTALVDNSLQMLEYGIEQGLNLTHLYSQLDLYSLLLYENGLSSSVDFQHFEQLSLIEKMNLILSKHDPIFAIENVFDKFIHKLSKFKQENQLKVDKKELLREFMVNLAKTDFDQCLKIFESCSMVDKTLEQIESLKIVNDACDLIELASECIYAYEDPACLDLAFRVMECLPDRSQADILMGDNAAKIRHFNRVNDQADQIEYYLSMIEVFREYNTHLTVKDIRSIVSSKSATATELFFSKVINNFCTTKFFANADISLEWKNFLWNLQDFRKNSLDAITSQQLVEMCVHNLLFSGKKVFIELALSHISFKANKTSTKKVPYEKGREMLRKAANDYLKFANPIQDDNIELARVCLQAFKDHNDTDEELLEELDLIEALSIMYADFGFDMLPIKVKQFAQPRIDLIEMLLKGSKNSYSQVSKVLHLSKLLRVCKDSTDEHREGVVLSMIGKEAIHEHDYQAVHEVCQMVLQRNLQHAWDLCYHFAKTATADQTLSTQQQLAFLSFALAYCPETDVDAHFSILHEIKSIKASANKKQSSNAFIEFKGELSVK